MQSLPAPLLPPEVDLTDFDFMPLDVRRLRDSRISAIATGDEFQSAVLLWCAAWHQRPAASLPNDDIELAQLTGFGRVVSEWLKVKDGALHGWVKCSDGRLYHPVVAEKAIEGWNGKLLHKWKKECDRLRKENEKRKSDGKPALDMPDRPSAIHAVGPEKPSMIISAGNDNASVGSRDLDHGTASVPQEIPRKSLLEGEGQGEGELKNVCPKPDKPVRTRHPYTDDFEAFWSAYPTDSNMPKLEAWKVWSKLTENDRASATASIPGFVDHCRKDTTYRPVHAHRFLSQRRFDGFLQQKAPGFATREDDPRIEFGGGWSSPLSVAVKSFKDGKWKADQWGPPPGEPRCRVPGGGFWPAFGLESSPSHPTGEAA